MTNRRWRILAFRHWDCCIEVAMGSREYHIYLADIASLSARIILVWFYRSYGVQRTKWREFTKSFIDWENHCYFYSNHNHSKLQFTTNTNTPVLRLSNKSQMVSSPQRNASDQQQQRINVHMNTSEIDGIKRFILWYWPQGIHWKTSNICWSKTCTGLSNVYFIFMSYLYYSSTSKRIAYIAQGLPCSC